MFVIEEFTYEKNRNTIDGPTGGGYMSWAYSDDHELLEELAAVVDSRVWPLGEVETKEMGFKNPAYQVVLIIGLGWDKKEDTKAFVEAQKKIKEIIERS